MTKWAYLIVGWSHGHWTVQGQTQLSFSTEPPDMVFSLCGEEGWELATTSHPEPGRTVFYFKKPKPS